MVLKSREIKQEEFFSFGALSVIYFADNFTGNRFTVEELFVPVDYVADDGRL